MALTTFCFNPRVRHFSAHGLILRTFARLSITMGVLAFPLPSFTLINVDRNTDVSINWFKGSVGCDYNKLISIQAAMSFLGTLVVLINHYSASELAPC